MIKCVKCNKELPDGSIYCSYCGEKQDKTLLQNIELKCVKCGNTVKKDEIFCTHCGANLKEKNAVGFVTEKQKKSKTKQEKNYIKKLVHNIVALSISVFLIIFSILPIFTFNFDKIFSEEFGVTTNTDFNIKLNIFDFLEVPFALINDTDSEAYGEELQNLFEDRVSQATATKLYNGQELTLKEKQELNSVFEDFNILKLLVASDIREQCIVSIATLCIAIILFISALIMPLIYLAYGTLGIIKNKIYAITKYSFLITMSIMIAFMLILDASDCAIAPKLYLYFSIAGLLFTIVYKYITTSEKLSARPFIKKSVCSATLALILLMLTSNIVVFKYLDTTNDKEYKDGENSINLIDVSDAMLYNDYEYLTQETVNARVQDVITKTRSQREFIFKYSSSFNNMLTEDMYYTYKPILILSAFIPLLVYGSYGLLLTLLILNVIQILNNKYNDKNKHYLFSGLSVLLQFIVIAFTIAATVFFNESCVFTETNIALNITAWPFITFVFTAGLILYMFLFKNSKKVYYEYITLDNINKNKDNNKNKEIEINKDSSKNKEIQSQEEKKEDKAKKQE